MSTFANSPATSAVPSIDTTSNPVIMTTTNEAISNVPSITAQDITNLTSAIDTFSLLLGVGVTLPSADEIRRLAKARKSAPVLVPTIADLATRYKVASQAFPLSDMLARQDLVKTLAPVAERIAAVSKLVNEISLMAQSGAWEGAMVNYGLLKSEARGNTVLRTALDQVRDEMRVTYVTPEGTKTVKKGRAAKKATAPSTPAPAVTAPVAPVVAAAPAAVAPAPVAAATPNATLSVSAVPAVLSLAHS